MPYKSDQQRKLFEGCRNNPESMSHCPPKKVVEKFHQAEYHPETRKAHEEQKRRGQPKFH